MAAMKQHYATIAMIAMIVVGTASAARAQSGPPEDPWSFDVGLGWDNGITGQINSSGIGTINNQVVVVTNNSYNDVYGAGLHLRFGGGYMFNQDTEARVTFTFQSLDADFVVPMGDIGTSNLYGQYTDYQTFGLDVGLRRYVSAAGKFRPYGEGTIGIGFVDKTDVTLVAPGANLIGEANDFYDQTAAFTFGLNAGVLVDTGSRVGVYAQLGLRWVSGMAQIDDLASTGLGNINDKSSRWTLPFLAGIRIGF
jgi:opacity protein-like surface antigen